MADDAGVAAEQAAPGALAIASAVHDRVLSVSSYVAL